MNGKRGVAANLLTRTGIIAAINRVRPRISNKLTILAYHRVLDVENEDSYPFDIDLISASTAGFREQMRLLRRHYNPITFATLLDHQRTGTPLPPGAAIVTFDDGFDDNFRNAFPILKETGVPATIFLTTSFIDGQRTIWFEALAYRVMCAPPTTVRLAAQPGVSIEVRRDRSSRRRVLHSLLEVLKRVPNRERLALLADLERQLPVGEDLAAYRASQPLSWAQIREMSREGIEFGSHSVTHPILSMLTPEELRFELETSRQRIEVETGRPVHVLAYPVGGRNAFSPDVKRAARSAGYELGVSYLRGVQDPSNWDPFEIRRIHVERYIDMRMFAATLALPEAFIP